jgi:hypothetical protein
MNIRLAMLAAVVVPLLGFAGSAHALAQNATSIKYFDESGRVVGQQIRLCSALSYHAGNIHTAYTITEETACGSNPPLTYIVAGTIITHYILPASETISYACGLASCEPSYAPEPERLLNQGWTWQNLWN